MSCPELPADLLAYADQRMASCATFLDKMVAGERRNGHACVVDWATLSNDLESNLTAVGALSDALALAIQRLAAT